MNKITMVKVAELCGVSLKTVSRVINQPQQVSEATRNRVQQAMASMGYQVNLLAKGLKQSRTNIIVVFLDRHDGEYLNAWRNCMLRHLFDYAREMGLKTVVSPSNAKSYKTDETDGFNLLSSGIADGAILLEYLDSDSRVQYLEESNIPYVILGQPRAANVSAVSMDHFDAGWKGGNYLQSRGYKNIFFLTAEQQVISTELKEMGFLSALKESESRGTVIYGAESFQKAYLAAKQILEEQNPDCFFVSGDEGALGVYKAVQERSLKIPQDIGVLSITNLPSNEFLWPPLSSLCQDFALIAKECITMLDSLLKKEEKPEGEEASCTLIPSKIIERGST